jgi:CheY-like chemotaxis protein
MMTAPKFDSDLILVVDDVSENLQLAKIYLEKLGWKVMLCDSGEQALRKLAQVVPAAILLDIKMPGIDGLSLAKIIQSSPNNAQIRIVGYTAHALKDEVQNILASGFESVLIKPVTYLDISNTFGANIQFL